MTIETEDIRRELNNKQKEVFALASDISDLETRAAKIKNEVMELYEKIDSKLNGNERRKDEI